MAWAGAAAWQRRHAPGAGVQRCGSWQSTQRACAFLACSPPFCISAGVWHSVHAASVLPSFACGRWHSAHDISMGAPCSFIGARIPWAEWQRMQSRRVGRSPGSFVRNSWQAKQWRLCIFSTFTACPGWHSTHFVATGSKPCMLAAWQRTHAILFSSTWMR